MEGAGDETHLRGRGPGGSAWTQAAIRCIGSGGPGAVRWPGGGLCPWLRAPAGSLARLLLAELDEKLDPGVPQSFAELRASDLAERARAYKQVVEAGRDAGDARRHAGFGS